MKKIIYYVFFIVLPFLVSAQNFERSLIGNAGQQSTNGSISLDWSIGETMVTDFQNSKASLSQGLNQWVKISTAVKELPDWQKDIMAYPNPFTNKVTLKSNKLRNYTIELYNTSGNFILKQKWNGVEKNLLLEYLQEGSYFFLIKDSKGESITLKAIKLNKN